MNKVLAAVLTAGIVASASGVISRILYHVEVPEEPAYPIAVAEGEANGEAAPEAPPLAVLLAGGDASSGESVARACAACHTFEEGGANRIGPNLWDVVGRDIASVGGFSYSEALATKEGAWDYESLSAFLENPREWAPGTKMSYAGLRDHEQLADLILYLRSLAAEPAPLPEPPAEQPGEAAQAEAGEQTAAAEEGEAPPADATQQADGEASQTAAGGFADLLAQADPGAGESKARQCVACHTFEEDGANRIGPNLWGIVGRDIASVEGFSYSDVLQNKEGAWDYESLNAYLTNPREWAPGTRMAFAGVRQDEDRADLIAYLRSMADEPPPLPGGG